MTSILKDLFDRLLQAYGHQHWWPGMTTLEAMIGAILVRNASPRNAEKALDNLRRRDLLHPRVLYQLPLEELAELIRPAGSPHLKARRLHNLLALVVRRYDGSMERMFQSDVSLLREELLGINGIGRETADWILLYAGRCPTFVVDTHTFRICARHGWLSYDAGYDEIKEYFESGLEKDAALFQQYHTLLVRVGLTHCGKTPRCGGCPLAELLPDGVPRQPEY